MMYRLAGVTTFSVAALLVCYQAADPPAKKVEDQDKGIQLGGPTGRVRGLVTFSEKNLPTPTVITNKQDSQACGTKFTKLDVVISHENRGIANVVLWLTELKLPEDYQPPRQDLRLAAQRCQFRPRVAAMTAGSKIMLQNTDPIGHSANLSGVLTETVQLAKKGEEFTADAGSTGLIEIRCDDHEWMEAFVHVHPHPFHAVTDSEGQFEIEGVPVGTHKMKTWHEKFPEQDLEVVVRSGETTQLELAHPPKKKANSKPKPK